MVTTEGFGSEEVLEEIKPKIREKFSLEEGERWVDLDEDRVAYEIGLGRSAKNIDPAAVMLVQLALEALDAE